MPPSRKVTSLSQRPQALFAMAAENVPLLFPPEVLARLRESVDIDPALVAQDFTDPRVLGALARGLWPREAARGV